MRRIILLLATIVIMAMLLALAGGPALAVKNIGCQGIVITPAVQKVREAATKPLGNCADVEPVTPPGHQNP